MRILLIAHEFPPIPSAQSLRWAYLARELARLGHEIDVLAPGHAGYGPTAGLPGLEASVRIHRTHPGLVAGFLARRGRGQGDRDGSMEGAARTSVRATPAGHSEDGLNWKGRLFQRLEKAYGHVLFPDRRAEWNPWARRALDQLIVDARPDVVIASHEPAGTLVLGIEAKKTGCKLVADLGDPVCAPYTPARWRRRALRLERDVCEKADLVTVTTNKLRNLLVERHSVNPSKIFLLTQGYDDAPVDAEASELSVSMEPGQRLELLYTGSFYAFRDAQCLIDAVLATPGARLSVASPTSSVALVEAALKAPGSIRLLGWLSHGEVLRLQRRAGVLVNIANDDSTQVPGKVYEYLGAARPILHIGDDPDDEAAALIRRTGAGTVCRKDASAIASLLARHWQQDGYADRIPRGDEVSRYAWSAHARALVQKLTELQ